MKINGPISVTYNLAPQEGTRAVRIDFAFPADNGAMVDLSQLLSQGEFRQVQTLFIDNSANAQALTIASNSLNQTIQVPAGAQGFVPILAPNPLRFTVSSTGSAASIFALNYSVSPALWGISSGGSSTVSVSNFPTNLGYFDEFLAANPNLINSLVGLTTRDYNLTSALLNSLASNGKTPLCIAEGTQSNIQVISFTGNTTFNFAQSNRSFSALQILAFNLVNTADATLTLTYGNASYTTAFPIPQQNITNEIVQLYDIRNMACMLNFSGATAKLVMTGSAITSGKIIVIMVTNG